jgi:hypothetical protein
MEPTTQRRWSSSGVADRPRDAYGRAKRALIIAREVVPERARLSELPTTVANEVLGDPT